MKLRHGGPVRVCCRRYPMLPPNARSALLLLASLVACTSPERRCLPGYEAVPGSSPFRCVMGDGGGGDARADADVPQRLCDGGRVCDEPGDGVDSNNDRVDGELSDTIFVAESGNDMANGGLPDQPVRSLPTALERAAAMNRRTILMQAGSYNTSGLGTMEMPRLVSVTRTVQIIGRYSVDAAGPQWVRRNAMGAGGDTSVVAPQAGVIVMGAADVQIRGMTLEGRTAQQGASVYGILAIEAPRLLLQEVTLLPGDAGDGVRGDEGVAGADGAMGQAGAEDGTGGRGGPACVGSTNAGGVGGSARSAAMPMAVAPSDGMASMGVMPGGAGRNGTDMSGATQGADGARGDDGAPGRPGGTGFWTRDGFVPDRGGAGGAATGGGGGGGGGAGFTDMPTLNGGGGGGGGGGACGGGGGEGGGGGGASVGAYLVGTRTNATFDRCQIRTGRGGNGAPGGVGGARRGGTRMPPQGGAGGMGAMGRSANNDGAIGGRGGNGGIGGAGGPGLGGPVIGIARVGGATTSVDLATQGAIRLGTPGMHGPGAESFAPALSQPEISPMADTLGDGGVRGDGGASDAAMDVAIDRAVDAAREAGGGAGDGGGLDAGMD